MQHRFKAKHAGFSLIELLLVLGVLAILLIAAFVVYPQVRDRNQANAEIQKITAIKANLTNLYASRGGNYTGMLASTVIQAKAVPASSVEGTLIKSAWGKEIMFSVDSGASTATMTPGRTFPQGRYYSIIYAEVPNSICLPLVSGAAGNFQGIRVNDTQVIGSDGQLDVGIASRACSLTQNPDVVFYTN